MKSLFITVLILGAAFAGYDYFLAPPWERWVFKREARPVPPSAAPAAGDSDHRPAAPQAPAPVTRESSGYTPSIPVVPAREFVPPTVASLEELTQNWRTVPGHAFPRPVKLLKEVDVKMAMGSARIPAGAAAYAFGVTEGMVSVAPTETSTARGAVAIADTDLPMQLRQSYEEWKAARVEAARQAWLGRKTAKPTRQITVNEPVDVAGGLDPAGKPVRHRDGTYPLLLASMNAGEVTDITLPRVRRWGSPEPKTIGGKPAWTVDVWYETMAFCGPIEARAQAQVLDGKVIAWIYPGSGEQVP